MIFVKCEEDTDMGFIDEMYKNLSLDAAAYEPPTPLKLLRTINHFFVRFCSRQMGLIYLFGSNNYPSIIPQFFYHPKMRNPVLKLERTRSNNLSGVVDPNRADLLYSGAHRDYGAIQNFMIREIRTAKVDEYVPGNVIVWHPTLATAWQSIRKDVKTIMSAKVVDDMADYHKCKTRELCNVVLFVPYFLVLWPVIFGFVVHHDHYGGMIASLLFKSAGVTMQEAVRHLKLKKYLINLSATHRSSVLITDATWTFSGVKSVIERAPMQGPDVTILKFTRGPLKDMLAQWLPMAKRIASIVSETSDSNEMKCLIVTDETRCFLTNIAPSLTVLGEWVVNVFEDSRLLCAIQELCQEKYVPVAPEEVARAIQFGRKYANAAARARAAKRKRKAATSTDAPRNGSPRTKSKPTQKSGGDRPTHATAFKHLEQL